MGLNEGRKRQWAYPFFGLTDEYKVKLHELLFDLVYHGSIEYFAVYEMPVHYRTFYTKKLVNTKEREQKSVDSAVSKASDSGTPSIARGPAINRNQG